MVRTSVVHSADLEHYVVSLFEKLDSLPSLVKPKRFCFRREIRTLEFWRAVVAECLATFFLVFLICGSYVSWASNGSSNAVRISIATGVTMTTIIQSFRQISGANVNPAVTIALVATRKISAVRGFLYVTAQCSGAIAGTAVLYGIVANGHQGNLGATLIARDLLALQGFGMEYVITFILVFAIFQANDHRKKSFCPPSISIGVAYAACTSVAISVTGGSMNPARSLGPAFVMNKWNSHWIFWIAPILGALSSAFMYEFIFNNWRRKSRKGSSEDTASTRSDDVNSEESQRIQTGKESKRLRLPQSEQYRPPLLSPASLNFQSPPPSYSFKPPSVSSRAASKHPECIYEGTRSLYVRSPASPTVPHHSRLQRSDSMCTRMFSMDYGMQPVRSGGNSHPTPAPKYPCRSVRPPLPPLPISKPSGIYGGVNSGNYNDSLYGVFISPQNFDGKEDQSRTTQFQEPIYQTRNEALYGQLVQQSKEQMHQQHLQQFNEMQQFHGFPEPDCSAAKREECQDSVYGTYRGTAMCLQNEANSAQNGADSNVLPPVRASSTLSPNSLYYNTISCHNSSNGNSNGILY